MRLNNGKLGFLLGTFIGGIISSTGTILVLKKLKKLEEKAFNEAESEAILEVTEYYKNKIKYMKKVPVFEVKYAEYEHENPVEYHKEEPKITNPKFLYQEQIAAEDNKKPIYDYSKISKAKYTDLQKEYEREELDVEEHTFS